MRAFRLKENIQIDLGEVSRGRSSRQHRKPQAHRAIINEQTIRDRNVYSSRVGTV